MGWEVRKIVLPSKQQQVKLRAGQCLVKLIRRPIGPFLLPWPYLGREQSPQISGRISHPVYHVLSWSWIELLYGGHHHRSLGTGLFALHCYPWCGQDWEDSACSSCCLISAGCPGLHTAAGASRWTRRWCAGVCSATTTTTDYLVLVLVLVWTSRHNNIYLFQINSLSAATCEANNTTRWF